VYNQRHEIWNIVQGDMVVLKQQIADIVCALDVQGG